MGKRGPTRRGPGGPALERTQLQQPDLPDGMCDEAVAAWQSYWSDPVALALTPADLSMVLRWLDSTNRYLVYSRAVDEEPLVLGSTGQQVANPLCKLVDSALAALERCERQLGIGARNRAGLGLALMSERRSLADLNKRFEPLSIVPDDDETHDPRTDRPDPA